MSSDDTGKSMLPIQMYDTRHVSMPNNIIKIFVEMHRHLFDLYYTPRLL